MRAGMLKFSLSLSSLSSCDSPCTERSLFVSLLEIARETAKRDTQKRTRNTEPSSRIMCSLALWYYVSSAKEHSFAALNYSSLKQSSTTCSLVSILQTIHTDVPLLSLYQFDDPTERSLAWLGFVSRKLNFYHFY